MKKIYLLASFLGAATFAFNQVGQIQLPASKQMMKLSKQTNRTKSFATNYANQKAAGDSIWGSNFSDNMGWTTGEQTSTEGNWVIGTFNQLPSQIQAGQAYYTPMHTDPTDSFAFFDGLSFLLAENGTGNSVTSQNAWIETPVLDFTGIDHATVTFDQEYRSFNKDNTYVEVSLDGGTTWVQKQDPNSDIPSNAYANLSLVHVNFNTNGSSTVKFRFRWESLLAQGDNPFSGSGYAWEIDNVKISETYTNDLSTSNIYPSDGNGFTYHRIPMEQVGSIVASVDAKNMGTADQTNVVLDAAETTAGYTGASPAGVTIVPDSTETLQIPLASGFTPSAVGNYQLDYTVSSDATDADSSNNQIASYKFNVGGMLYAADSTTNGKVTGTPASGTGIGSWSPTQFLSPEALEPTIPYTINQNEVLTGIDFKYGSGDSLKAGALMIGKLLVFDSTAQVPWVDVAETEQYITKATDGWTYHTLVFDNPQPLTAGKLYAVSIQSFDYHFSIATCGNSKDNQWIYYSPSDQVYYRWGSDQPTPIIRMNFDPTLGTSSNKMVTMNVSQFPNPFANETTVRYNLKDANAVSYTVVDMAGNVIANGNQGNQTAGSHSFKINGASFANGIYFLKLKAGNSIITKKMVVNK